MKFSPGRT